MSRSVAFLRGINVGGHRVTNDQLLEVFIGLGLTGVGTFLASGNVVFDDRPDVTADAMSSALEDAFGFAVPTTVRNGEDLQALADAEPFPADAIASATGKPQVILLFDRLSPSRRQAVVDRSTSEDLLVPAGRAVHWLPASGISGTGLTPDELHRLVGQNTVRTTNTIRRLLTRL